MLMCIYRPFDTPSVFCRDIEKCREVAITWFGPDQIVQQQFEEKGKAIE
jgi:hypothetical protein